jgi:hypothetical protein
MVQAGLGKINLQYGKSIQRHLGAVKFTFTIMACFILAGCGVRGDDEALSEKPPEGYQQLNRGIPILLGASAASIQFTDGIGVTVAHNKVVIPRKLWHHPTHDIAFFKLDKKVPMWADAKNGDMITAYGNSKTRKNRVLKTQIILS